MVGDWGGVFRWGERWGGGLIFVFWREGGVGIDLEEGYCHVGWRKLGGSGGYWGVTLVVGFM